MRLILTDSNEYLLSPDIEVCGSMEDVYTEVERYQEDKEALVFVDVMYSNLTVLKQLELFRFEFKNFRIILDITQSIMLDLNTSLHKEYYALTTTTNTASELFLNAIDYEESDTSFNLEELERLLTNKAVIKNMVDFDFISLKTMLSSLLSTTKMLGENNIKGKDELQFHIKEKIDVIKNFKLAKERLKLVEENREQLLEENLKMKFDGYIDILEHKPAEITTPLAYVKCILLRDEDPVLKLFSLLNGLLRKKYNINSCLVVIEDANSLKMKKIRKNYTYVSADGKYSMNMGEKIITTPHHVESLFENWEKFAGVKDLFIVVDLTLNTRTSVIGEGTYIVVSNDRIQDSYKSHMNDLLQISEEEIASEIEGEDDFNVELNLTQTKLFLNLENLMLDLV